MIKNLLQDARTILFVFLSIFTIYALTTPSFSRSIPELFVTIATCIVLDFLLLKFYKGISIFPKSGLISSFGIFLLCDSPHLWIYGFLAALAILTKHFITYESKHFFNPNNVALALGVLFLNDKMTIAAGTWGGNFLLVPLFSTLGVYLVYRVNRLYLTLSFLLSFAMLALTRCFVQETSFFWALLPLTGPSFFLYLFYMLTDPKTTPTNKTEQIFFGILVALTDATFRYYKNKYALVLSLFIITGSYPLLSHALEFQILKDLKNKSIKGFDNKS